MTELSDDEKIKKFMTYLEKKYFEFCQRLGRVANQAAFARFVGISPASLSQYMNGYRLPDYRNLTKLAIAFGPEVYDILGIEREDENDPRLMYLLQAWRDMSSKDRSELIRNLKSEAGKLETQGG